jgi:choline dehydrogenase
VGASNQFEAAGFIRSRAGVDYPDIQFHFLPLAVRYDGRAAVRGHGYQVHVGPMRSKSRGRGAAEVGRSRRRARDPVQLHEPSRGLGGVPPRDPAHARDPGPAGLRALCRRRDPAGPGVETDAEIDAFVRDHAESAYHPCGTCRMGRADDPMAVVDPEARVIGVEGLRVADSSIFPQVTNGNTNAPSIMVGEKAADHVLGRRLAPLNLVPWEAPGWRTAQR